MHPDGTGVRRITADLPAVSHPSWSADGTADRLQRRLGTASDIYTIRPDGSGLDA